MMIFAALRLVSAFGKKMQTNPARDKKP